MEKNIHMTERNKVIKTKKYLVSSRTFLSRLCFHSCGLGSLPALGSNPLFLFWLLVFLFLLLIDSVHSSFFSFFSLYFLLAPIISWKEKEEAEEGDEVEEADHLLPPWLV